MKISSDDCYLYKISNKKTLSDMLISEILNEIRLLIEEIFKDIKISLLYIPIPDNQSQMYSKLQSVSFVIIHISCSLYQI